MTRHAAFRPALALLLALGGCTGRPAPISPPQSAVASGAMCRVGADGAIPVADRGIGGTGVEGVGLADAGLGGATLAAARGIGGTGLVADRGIGGTGARTGIVGVITGFASVCLAGQEVAYAPDLPITVDGAPSGVGVLRAGQVAAIEAAPTAVGQPMALRMVVRHEVSGPFERVEPDGALRIAGQRVVPPQYQAGAAPPLVPGAWVAVSGFRREDGTVVATRLDARGPGEVMVRGVLVPAGGALRIGTLEVRPASGQLRQPGVPMVAVGRLSNGILFADTVEPDELLVDPGVFFGNRVTVLYVEGYAEGGVLRFGRGLRVGAPFQEGRGLARLERRPGGGFAAAFVRRVRVPAFEHVRPGGRGGFEPAPVPRRGFGPPNRFGRGGRGAVERGGPRQRGYRRGDAADQSTAGGPADGAGGGFNGGPDGGGGDGPGRVGPRR